MIAATPAGRFGQEVAEALRELTSVLESAARSPVDPDRFDALFRTLGKIEGASYQLRGTLFEYLGAELAGRTLGSDVRMNYLFKNAEGQEAEADVIAIRPDQNTTAIECKGYSPRGTIPDDKVLRWVNHNVPVWFRAINAHPDWQNFTPHFEFWTSGRLTPEGLVAVAQARTTVNSNRYTPGLRLNERLQQDCVSTGNAS